MADDSAMGSLLAAVAVAAASSNTQTQTTNAAPAPIPTPPSSLSTTHLPTRLPPISIPPPPPPLPPPLPSPPPLPPMSIRRPNTPFSVNQPSPISAPPTEKRKGARIFSAHEKKILEANYARNKFPSRLHMETLGNAMGKGTEKVRTWYNNRRAQDRKQGVDVNRIQPCHPLPSPTHSANNTPKLSEDTVILPNHVASSPASRPEQPIQTSPKTPNPNSSKLSSLSCHKHSIVQVTPNSISWTPSVSPVTTARNSQAAVSPSPCSSATRYRTTPLRIRNVRLQIISHEICGEIPEQLSLDNGLEVKFLFGKKRIVYEWYCGPDYGDAQNTGGPYAKMEMTFTSISTLQLIQETTKSVLIFSFSSFPTLYLQTQESMLKYRVRAQQRQYRKVSPNEFPISVTADQHKISMRRDEATRVLKLLREDIPGLPSFPLAQGDSQQPWNVSPQVHPLIPQPTKAGSEPGPVIGADHSVANAPQVAKRRPFIVFGASSKQQHNGQSNTSAPREENIPGSNPNTRHYMHAPIRSTISCEASGNAIGQRKLFSPATPVVPPRRLEKDSPWPTPRESQVLTKPSCINSIIDKRSPHASVGHVRRELDFNDVSRQSAQTVIVGSKRAMPETSSDNETKLKTRRKLTGGEASPSALPRSISKQRHDNQDSEAKPDVGDANPSKDKEDVISSRVVSQNSILRVLPR